MFISTPVLTFLSLSFSLSLSLAAPAAPVLQDNSGGESGDRAEYLRFHNEARAQHGARPVTFSSELEGFAQEWANNCDFKHSGGKFGRIGENLAAGTGAYPINEMINDWVVEVKDYNPSNPKASHFTQVVWKETTEIGCAKQTCTGIFGNTPATYYGMCNPPSYSISCKPLNHFFDSVRVPSRR